MVSDFKFLSSAFEKLGLHGFVTSIHAAVSASHGSANFPDLPEDTENVGRGTGNQNRTYTNDVGKTSPPPVTVVTLDEIVHTHNILGKIDVLSIGNAVLSRLSFSIYNNTIRYPCLWC